MIIVRQRPIRKQFNCHLQAGEGARSWKPLRTGRWQTRLISAQTNITLHQIYCDFNAYLLHYFLSTLKHSYVSLLSATQIKYILWDPMKTTED